MFNRICSLFLSTLLLMPVLSVSATDSNTNSNTNDTPSLDTLVLDSNLAVCEYLRTYYYKEDYTCSNVSNFTEYSLPAGVPFRAPYNQPLVLKNVNIKITGYNVGFSFHSPVEIIDSTISSTHGCLFYLTENNVSNLTLTSGVFKTEKTESSDAFSNIPSPICSLNPDPAAATSLFNAVLAPNTTYYKQDALTQLSSDTDQASGESQMGKVGPSPVRYLASSTIVVKNTNDPATDDPTPDDPGSDDSTPDPSLVIPKTPNTGVQRV